MYRLMAIATIVTTANTVTGQMIRAYNYTLSNKSLMHMYLRTTMWPHGHGTICHLIEMAMMTLLLVQLHRGVVQCSAPAGN